MSKGQRTRKEIIEKAFILAGDIGLEALSLGMLATETGLSKSGLFAHFKSKEALQLDLIEEVIARFTRSVIRPALAEARGEPRLRMFFDRYLDWITYSRPNGGCIYMTLCQEYGDRPGPMRDRLLASQLELRETLARMLQIAKDEGHFRADLDIEQFTFAFTGIKMAYQDELKFLRMPNSLPHARAAFDELLARSRAPTPQLT
jgi:AcrR family transcriptional regulator